MSDFSSDIFSGLFSDLTTKYELKNASDEQVKLYQKAYKQFKKENKETKAILHLQLDTNTINFNHFSGLDMYKFGYLVAKNEN